MKHFVELLNAKSVPVASKGVLIGVQEIVAIVQQCVNSVGITLVVLECFVPVQYQTVCSCEILSVWLFILTFRALPVMNTKFVEIMQINKTLAMRKANIKNN